MGLLDWFTREPKSKPSASEQEMQRMGETLRENSKRAMRIAEELDRARRDLPGGQTT